jgi:hypothetical protein
MKAEAFLSLIYMPFIPAAASCGVLLFKVKKQLWGSEFWSDGGYVGTVGDGVMSDIIRNYVETQGTPEEKEDYKQMNLLEFG